MTNRCDKSIKILGAGISGLSTAITLAKNEFDVEIFEKSSRAGGRFKRDFQGLRNFGNGIIDPLREFKKLGIKIKPYNKLNKIIRYSRSRSFEVISDDKPLYYLVLRGGNKNSIDSQLEALAINSGVNISYNTRSNIDDVDIIATGPLKGDSFAYGEIYEDTNIHDVGYAFLDKRYSPGGYLYIIPGKKKGEAGIINSTFDSTVKKQTVKTLYDKAIKENDVLKDLLDGATRKSSQGGIGCCTLLDNPYQNKKYYVGEAAGLQDGTAGFGIRYAIISGCLAAQSIITGKDYTQLIARDLKNQLDFERIRSETFKKLTNNEIDKIFQSINEKFGHKLTIDEYESMRGVI